VQKKLIAFAGGNASALSDVTALQRAQCALSASVSNASYWTLPSDFFRLRSVALTYQLPLVRSQDASITIAGRNLALWTKYKGVDPEVSDLADPWGSRGLGRREYYNLPPSRTFLATVRVAF
jgi:iron complex outermembrane receptor protein